MDKEKMIEELRNEFHSADFHFEAIDDPQFDKRGIVHDWRNHVPKAFRDHWGELSDDARFAIYAICEWAAHNEEWE